MPRTYSSIEEIRAELAWVNETPDPRSAAAVLEQAELPSAKLKYPQPLRRDR